MIEFEVNFSLRASLPTPAAIEAAIRRAGLRATLAQYPGCTHWHLKKGVERGVLELTRWPDQKRLWLTVQDGRKGDWVIPAARLIKSLLKSKVAQSRR